MSGPRGFLVIAGAGRATRVPVAYTWFKAVGADTDGAFAFLEYVMTYDIPAHTHLREHENLYMLEGSVRVRVGDDEFSAGVAISCSCPAGPHASTATSASPPRLLAVSSPSGFEHFMEDLTEVLAAGYHRNHLRWRRYAKSMGESSISAAATTLALLNGTPGVGEPGSTVDLRVVDQHEPVHDGCLKGVGGQR